MRFIFTCFLLLSLQSCQQPGSRDRELDNLNHRVEMLEQRIDSLTHGESTAALGINGTSARLAGDRCHAQTKKGTPCKRKAKSNGYCWQHAK